MTTDKKPELPACPFCGELPGNAYHDDHVICDTCRIEMSRKDWNRRYVCDDKNGKPVYAGDEVNVEWPNSPIYRCKVTFTTVRGVLFEWLDGDDCWDWDEAGEIELIQEQDHD